LIYTVFYSLHTVEVNVFVTQILQNMLFCVQEKKEIHTGF